VSWMDHVQRRKLIGIVIIMGWRGWVPHEMSWMGSVS